MNQDYINKLLQTKNEKKAKLNQIVSDNYNEEKLLINTIYNTNTTKVTRGEAISDSISAFGGSWKFIILFLLFMFIWITINVYWLANNNFDPYPFILLNLLLSSLAALQAPIIMMRQNRQETIDRKRDENDYLINLKAELEIRTLHKKFDLMIIDQMKTIVDLQKQQVEFLKKLELFIKPKVD